MDQIYIFRRHGQSLKRVVIGWAGRLIATSIYTIAGLCVSLFVNILAEAAQIQKIRYSTEPDYTRIVLDLDGDVTYRMSPVGPSELQITLQDCQLNPDLPELALNDKIIESVQLNTEETDAMIMQVRLKTPVNAHIFAMKNPDRIVVDLHLVVAQASDESSTPEPDPSKAIPLKADTDPMLEFIQKMEAASLDGDPIQDESLDKATNLAVETNQAAETNSDKTQPTETTRTEDNQQEAEDILQPEDNLTGTVAGKDIAKDGAPAPDPMQPSVPAVSSQESQFSPPEVSSQWKISNPWILGQIVLDIFLAGMIGILWKHARTLNSTVRLQRARLNAIGQSTQQQPTKTKEAVGTQEIPQSTNQQGTQTEPLSAGDTDFETLLQEPGSQKGSIRTASSHNRATEQSRNKKRQQGSSSLRDTPGAQTQPDNGTSRKMSETATEDLSFDELQDALKKIGAQLESLIEMEPGDDPATESSLPSEADKQSKSDSGPQRAAASSQHSFHNRVIELANQGLDAIEISRELDIPRGEVELILSLHDN